MQDAANPALSVATMVNNILSILIPFS